jgi:acetylornithine deacetylase/succinyl-diaminopimelate desuccinylase-like protein
MLAFSRNPADKTAAATLATYPSHVGVIRTTCVATMLNAGHAENALPQSAKANINCRIFPGITVTEVPQVLRDIIDDDEVEVAMLGEPESAPASALREDVVDAISKGVHSIYPGLPIIPSMSTGATDGRTLRANGIPTYGSIAIFGRSEDNFAHGLNERVPVKSFFDALEHWHVVIKELAGR